MAPWDTNHATSAVHRHRSNLQLSVRPEELDSIDFSNAGAATNQHQMYAPNSSTEQSNQQQNPGASINGTIIQNPPLPKIPRIITTLKRSAGALSDSEAEFTEKAGQQTKYVGFSLFINSVGEEFLNLRERICGFDETKRYHYEKFGVR